MILVIIGHCNYYRIATPFGGLYYIEKNSDVSFLYECLSCLMSVIYSFHMPLFMSLSGMCYSLSKRSSDSINSLIRKKTFRLLIPFVVVTFFLSVPLKYVSGYWDNSQNIIIDVVCGQFLLMGNSHLWFIVSLFWIFLFFYYIEKKRLFDNKIWMSLIIISWIGLYIEPRCNFLGIPGAMKHLLFFSFGYHVVHLIDVYKDIKTKKLLLYLGIFILFSGSNGILLRHYQEIALLKVVRPLLFIVFAICGIVLFSLLSKKICSKSSAFFGGEILSFLKHNTYELYLYSDPFNYVIINICWIVFDGQIVVNNTLSLLVFFIRFIFTTFISILIIKLVSSLRLKDAIRRFATK